MKQQVNQPRVNQSHPNRPDPHGPRFLQAVEGWEQTEELQRKITATGRKLTGSEWFAIVRCFNQGCSHRMDIGDGMCYPETIS